MLVSCVYVVRLAAEQGGWINHLVAYLGWWYCCRHDTCLAAGSVAAGTTHVYVLYGGRLCNRSISFSVVLVVLCIGGRLV